MQRFIFIDIDGTLCNIHGEIPDSAITAIKKARGNGHKVLLCTGRAKSEIYPSVLQIGFDGIVGSAGAYVECDNQVIFHESIKDHLTKELVLYLQKDKTKFILETNQGAFIQKEDAKALSELFKASGVTKKSSEFESFMGVLGQVENVLEVKQVNKVLYFQSSKSLEQMQEDLKDHFGIVPNSIGAFGGQSGEISDKNINKSTGIEKVLTHYGKTKDTIIAFGDGANDIQMLQFAQVGIAMGNATDELKKYADDITDAVFEDGIYNSFIKYKLI